MKLLLPLKYYDDAGRVKPPSALYWCVFFLCRSLVILIGVFSSSQYGNELLGLFYPNNNVLYFNLLTATPAFLGLLIISFREKLWKVGHCWLFLFIKPCILFSVIFDLFFQIYLADQQHWQFSWIIAVTLMIDVLCLFFLSKDKHISLMVRDWRRTIKAGNDAIEVS